MITWFQENLGTVIVLLIVLAVIGLAVLSIVRDRKKGKNGCGCGCSGCAMRGECHKNTP